jgi:hypothetical protein
MPLKNQKNERGMKKTSLLLLAVILLTLIFSCRSGREGGITPPYPCVRIEGFVFDTTNFEPLNNAIIILDAFLDTVLNVVTYSDSAGFYEMVEAEEFDSHPILAYKEGYSEKVKFFSGYDGDTIVIDFYLTPE